MHANGEKEVSRGSHASVEEMLARPGWFAVQCDHP